MSRSRSRTTENRLNDVLTAADAIEAHLERGSVDDPLIFDAVRMRLVEIGEAVGALPPELLEGEPGIAWKEVVAMRHKLAHHYYDSALGIVAATAEEDVPILRAAVKRMLRRLSRPS